MKTLPTSSNFCKIWAMKILIVIYVNVALELLIHQKLQPMSSLKLSVTILENGFKDKLIAAVDFSFTTDETTDIADHVELSIFVRFIDSDSQEVCEKFLGLVEIVGSKGAETLFNKIKDVFTAKELDLKQKRFQGMDWTNTMSSEKSGLQKRLRHKVPHSKYVNCRNHKLALVFVQLLKDERFKALVNVDSIIIKVWKLMKYSSVKAAVYEEAQDALGQEKRKLLKRAATH